MIDDNELAAQLRAFAAEREWDQFHSPKNLATSISIESAELLEIFQWSRGQEAWESLNDASIKQKVEEEVADVFLYLIRFADKAGINLQKAAENKLLMNAKKYPVDKSKGTDKKYDELM